MSHCCLETSLLQLFQSWGGRLPRRTSVQAQESQRAVTTARVRRSVLKSRSRLLLGQHRVPHGPCCDRRDPHGEFPSRGLDIDHCVSDDEYSANRVRFPRLSQRVCDDPTSFLVLLAECSRTKYLFKSNLASFMRAIFWISGHDARTVSGLFASSSSRVATRAASGSWPGTRAETPPSSSR